MPYPLCSGPKPTDFCLDTWHDAYGPQGQFMLSGLTLLALELSIFSGLLSLYLSSSLVRGYLSHHC